MPEQFRVGRISAARGGAIRTRVSFEDMSDSAPSTAELAQPARSDAVEWLRR